ncbi:hypothetical protein ACVNS2_18025 [Paenibacillus caseinilyticus]|uniref:Uncharacterized protein n=1 Tax=Paenibacillus mucilaginosus (strain KNP414) TaxID=1036673 RepID=F8FDB1_PAEMK|nr:hypothetical protein [Paenibacillus mucilaginosus]AEI41771.1 hypothetical protein KNP414_03213 [Paenibacillus mucilaginosus KNP414]
MNDIGLTLSSEEIRSAIEKAVLDHNAFAKKKNIAPLPIWRGAFYVITGLGFDLLRRL